MFSTLLEQRAHKRQLRNLALEVEANARRLNGLPPLPADALPDGLVDILSAAATLLKRLPEGNSDKSGYTLISNTADPLAPPKVAAAAVEMSADDHMVSDEVGASLVVNDGDGLDDEPEAVPYTDGAPADDDGARPSATTEHLIRLRDWVLLARTEGNEDASPLLDRLYHELGKVLEHDGVVSIEDDGTFNVDSQLAVETEPTTDPALHDQVSGTVRPGYRLQNRVLRSQEVIVYLYSAPLDVAPDPA